MAQGSDESAFACGQGPCWLLAPQAVERPGGVFTDDGVRKLGGLLEPGHKSFVAGVAHGHAEIPQPATVLRTLDGRMGEDSAEVIFTE